ncbi:MAG TPA: hypothetical protein VM618_07095 [Acidimicrobiia bacterium]|nr:hypothetical protein [Acidimicrobiia bacterium]
MKTFRRVLAAFGLAGLVALVLGLRGRGGRPPAGNGWRELDLTDHAGGNGSRPGSSEASTADEPT